MVPHIDNFNFNWRLITKWTSIDILLPNEEILYIWRSFPLSQSNPGPIQINTFNTHSLSLFVARSTRSYDFQSLHPRHFISTFLWRHNNGLFYLLIVRDFFFEISLAKSWLGQQFSPLEEKLWKADQQFSSICFLYEMEWRWRNMNIGKWGGIWNP